MKHYLLYGISFIVFLSLGVTACQASGQASSTPTVFQSPMPARTPTATPTSVMTWKEVNADGVNLGIPVPPGWVAHKAQAGLLLAEHSLLIGSEPALKGMEMHIFVWRMSQFGELLPSLDNPALDALRRVVGDDSLMGNVMVTEPSPFDWDGLPAAYYLLSDGQESLGVVIGIGLPSPERLVILNLSADHEQRESIRGRLTGLLAGFTINGEPLPTAPLHHLPDPLIFPERDAARAGRS